MLELTIACVAFGAIAAVLGMLKPRGSTEQRWCFAAAYCLMFAALGLAYFGNPL